MSSRAFIKTKTGKRGLRNGNLTYYNRKFKAQPPTGSSLALFPYKWPKHQTNHSAPLTQRVSRQNILSNRRYRKHSRSLYRQSLQGHSHSLIAHSHLVFHARRFGITGPLPPLRVLHRFVLQRH
ncbi:hypothetical protein BD410DRAFT_781220 [Rickenella mellea]|uniref:Uncharacterized protein n=1 Tax=Rickenella mellea TaxID=50990 RepID=A0A4Y7QM09_9AGAM|nr:hypothetical protein BD410DRAFT_781220 [Rickenella mellea]